MSDTVISVEHLSKRYRLGVINTGTFKDDLKVWWAKKRGKPNPLAKIGQVDHGNRDLEYIWALRDVNFTVQRGEALGIIGRNGAGKSTLLKILSRVTAPTEGRVRVKGRIASLLEVGTGFHPELTGRENIYLNGAIMGMTRAEVAKKLEQIIDFSGVEQFIDTPVKRYSSGMYVRLAFAVAAHLEPEILIVDEVLAVGDAEFQKKCLGKMGEVAGEGRTVLFVSHNMGAIRGLCKRGIVLSQGGLSLDDEVEKAIDFYLQNGSSGLTPIIDLPEKTSVNTLGRKLGRGIKLIFYTQHANNPKAEFRIQGKFNIRLEFETYAPLKQVVAAVGIRTMQGIPLITYWSKPKALQPGRYHIDFPCDIPLKACDLTFAVGLTESGQNFYYNQDLGHVAISEVSSQEQPYQTKGAGILLGSSDAEIHTM